MACYHGADECPDKCMCPCDLCYLLRTEAYTGDAMSVSVRTHTTDPVPTPEQPVYTKVAHDGDSATQLWMIICDEGWRSSIVCEAMYEWAADWMLTVLGRKPFAPDRRP